MADDAFQKKIDEAIGSMKPSDSPPVTTEVKTEQTTRTESTEPPNTLGSLVDALIESQQNPQATPAAATTTTTTAVEEKPVIAAPATESKPETTTTTTVVTEKPAPAATYVPSPVVVEKKPEPPAAEPLIVTRETVTTQTPPKPKRKSKMSAVLIAILLLLVTLPAVVFFVSQQQQVTELRKKAAEPYPPANSPTPGVDTTKNSNIITFEKGRPVTMYLANLVSNTTYTVTLTNTVDASDVVTQTIQLDNEGTKVVNNLLTAGDNNSYAIKVHLEGETPDAYGFIPPAGTKCGKNGHDADFGTFINEGLSVSAEPHMVQCWGDAAIGDPTQDYDFNDFLLVFGYAAVVTPTNTPTNTPTETPTNTPTHTPTETPIPTETPTPTPRRVVVVVASPTPELLFAPSPTSSPTAAPIPRTPVSGGPGVLGAAVVAGGLLLFILGLAF